MSEIVNGEFSVGSGENTAADPADAALAILERDNPDPGPKPPPSEEPAPPTIPQPEPDGDEVSDEPEPVSATVKPRDETGKFKKLSGKERKEQIQADIARATAVRHQEERRIEELRQQRAQLEAETSRRPSPAASPADDSEPKIDQIGSKYADYEEFNRALMRWEGKQLIASERQRWEQEQQDKHQRQQEEYALQQHEQRLAAAQAKYPDWEQARAQAKAAITATGVPYLPKVLEYAFLTSEKGPDILHYLGTHPEELYQLTLANQHLPVEAAPLMRQYLESRLTASSSRGPVSTPISSAKAPIQPLGSAPVTPATNPDDMDFGPEYLRLVSKEGGRR